MMKYISKQKNSSKYAAFAIIMTAAAVFVITRFLPYRAFFQILAFVIAALGIHVTQRYVLSEFIYVITDKENGEAILSVTKVTGNKSTVVCRLSSSNCKYFGLASEFGEKLSVKYSYVQNFFPDSEYLFVYATEDGRRAAVRNVGVKFECDEEFAAEIAARVNTGRI